MRRIKLSEKPEKACEGVSTRNRTTATNASIEAVKMDRASINTPMIAVIKMANSCQASGDRSQGMGRCQMITPSTPVMIRLIHRILK